MSTTGKEKNHLRTRYYQITVYGKVDPSWSEWLAGLTLSMVEGPQGIPLTRLAGALPDQGALRGVLNKLWDLNLTLLSVDCGDYSSRRQTK
mgnify:FL=1